LSPVSPHRHLSPVCLRAISPSLGSCHFRPRRARAFTLIELLVVVAIIAILAGLALSTLGYVNKKGAESRAQSEVAALSAAIESFKLDNGFYPSSAALLYTNLCPPAAGARVYFEPTPQMLATNGGVVQFADPWGAAYGYSNFTNYFELWSTAGGANSNNWIRN
jgi:general secretion pathway protein G